MKPAGVPNVSIGALVVKSPSGKPLIFYSVKTPALRPWRLLAVFSLLSALVVTQALMGGGLLAQTATAADEDFVDVLGQLLALSEEDRAALPSDVQEFLTDFGTSPWIPSASFSAVAGYRDNVGLSALVPEAVGFAEGRAESFLMWQPVDSAWQALGILDGFYRRYANNPVTDAEQSWFSQLELKWKPLKAWDFKVRGQGFYQDEVVDLSTTAAQRTVLPVEVLNGNVDGGMSLRLPGGVVAQSRYAWRRADYRFVAEDYASTEWWNGLLWQPWSWMGLAYERIDRQRDYDFRQNVTPGGRPLPDTQLSFAQVDHEARGWVEWNRAGDWRWEAGWSELENRDEASGFYDYDGESWRGSLQWVSREEKWEVRVEWEQDRIDYLNQTVGAGLTPDPRQREDRWVRVEVWRRLGPAWDLRLEGEDLLSESNEIDASYRDRTYWLGLTYTY